MKNSESIFNISVVGINVTMNWNNQRKIQNWQTWNANKCYTENWSKLKFSDKLTNIKENIAKWNVCGIKGTMQLNNS